jgi:hypothetical protein
VQPDSLERLYRTKTDDELLALDANRDSLVSEARALVAQELAHRGLAVRRPPTHVESDTMLHRSAAMLRALKFGGLLLINVVVAIIGTAILETSIGRLFPAHSVVTVLWKEWILSITCAASIGFWMWHRWRRDAAKWTWVLPAVWFGGKFLLAIGSGAVGFQFSGTGWVNGNRLARWNFLLFTIPFVRGVAYSLGAYLASLVHATYRSTESMVPPTTGDC